MGGHRISPLFCPWLGVAPWRAGLIQTRREAMLKKAEEVMEILEAYDLTGSLRGAAALCGCDHKTVGQWVRARDAAGGVPCPESSFLRQSFVGFGFRPETKEMTGWLDPRSSRRRRSSRLC